MSTAEPWTVGRLLQWTADFLARHGSDSARLDAEVLLANALGCQRIELYTRFEVVPGDDVRTSFRELVKRRSEGMPVAYLVGRREFYSMSFRVSPAVLIPRPETEFLVIALLDLARRRPDAALKIVDVGTGSGVIAVCAAKYLPRAHVTAVDTSGDALEIARQNAATHGVESRIEFVKGDLLTSLQDERNLDFVVSNPPYVSQPEYDALDRQVKDHEPRAALVGGPTGVEVIERLIPQAADRLLPGGWLLVEISPMIHDAVRNRIESDGRFDLAATVRDLARQPRVVQASRKE